MLRPNDSQREPDPKVTRENTTLLQIEATLLSKHNFSLN